MEKNAPWGGDMEPLEQLVTVHNTYGYFELKSDMVHYWWLFPQGLPGNSDTRHHQYKRM